MALKAGKVLRGRPDERFAGAGLSEDVARPKWAKGTGEVQMDEGTTQQQMTVAFSTVSKQAELNQTLMSKYVMVTLGKAYKGDPKETIVLTYGREEATSVGPDSYRDEGIGTNPVPASERLFSQGMGQAPRWKPGNWIHYHLRFEEGPLGECSCGVDPETIVGPECVMPGPVARHYFGDWDVVSYELRAASMGVTVDSWLTRPWHRDRVASEHWGGYEMDFPASLQQIYDRNGALNIRALRKYGAPEIPDVTITRLDTMMRRLPNTAARVWDIFKWDEQLEKSPRMHFFDSNHQPAQGPDIQAIVAQAVAAALAAERATAEVKKGKSA